MISCSYMYLSHLSVNSQLYISIENKTGLSMGHQTGIPYLLLKIWTFLGFSINKLCFREYLPMGGSVNMVDETLKLAYGENSDLIKDKRIAAVQALSGTGACRLFADFQKRFSPDSQIYIPVPTWSKLVFLAILFVTSMLELLDFHNSIHNLLLTFWQPSQHLERCRCPSENIPLLSS